MIEIIKKYIFKIKIYIYEILINFLDINVLKQQNMELEKKINYLEKQHDNLLNKYKNKENEKIINPLYPEIDDLINYKWETLKFENIISDDKTTNQIQINIDHNGFKSDFSIIDSTNHKMLIKVVDPYNKANWQTPWMDACNATSLEGMFPIDGTRCIYGIFSSTERRVCFIGSQTSSRAIIYIRIGIPINLDISYNKITLEPVNKYKEKNII